MYGAGLPCCFVDGDSIGDFKQLAAAADDGSLRRRLGDAGALDEGTPATPSFMHLHLGFRADGLSERVLESIHHIVVPSWEELTAPQQTVFVSIPSLLDPSLAALPLLQLLSAQTKPSQQARAAGLPIMLVHENNGFRLPMLQQMLLKNGQKIQFLGCPVLLLLSEDLSSLYAYLTLYYN